MHLFLEAQQEYGTRWRTQQITTLCSCESQLKALHFHISYLLFYTAHYDAVIGNSMQAANDP